MFALPLHTFPPGRSPIQSSAPQWCGALYVSLYLAPPAGTCPPRPEIARADHGTSPRGKAFWRYRSVLPGMWGRPVTLGEGWTPDAHSRRYPGVYVKGRGLTPPEASRRRGLALGVKHGLAITALKKLAVPSAGNAAGRGRWPAYLAARRLGSKPTFSCRRICRSQIT